MNYKQVTCGSYIIDSNYRILVCHPTGHPHDWWTIPKGCADMGETHYDAAIRELSEETGINIHDYHYDLYDLGVIDYESKPKTLHGYAFCINGVIDQELKCLSTFTQHPIVDGKSVIKLPEIDAFQGLNLKIGIDAIQSEQRKLFTNFFTLSIS